MVEHWLKKANYLNTVSLVFALVAFVLLVLIIAVIVGYKFRKKLATSNSYFISDQTIKALEIEGLYTTKAPATLIQPQEDDTTILKKIAWILIAALLLVLSALILKKIDKLYCYRSSVE